MIFIACLGLYILKSITYRQHKIHPHSYFIFIYLEYVIYLCECSLSVYVPVEIRRGRWIH